MILKVDLAAGSVQSYPFAIPGSKWPDVLFSGFGAARLGQNFPRPTRPALALGSGGRERQTSARGLHRACAPKRSRRAQPRSPTALASRATLSHPRKALHHAPAGGSSVRAYRCRGFSPASLLPASRPGRPAPRPIQQPKEPKPRRPPLALPWQNGRAPLLLLLLLSSQSVDPSPSLSGDDGLAGGSRTCRAAFTAPPTPGVYSPRCGWLRVLSRKGAGGKGATAGQRARPGGGACNRPRGFLSVSHSPGAEMKSDEEVKGKRRRSRLRASVTHPSPQPLSLFREGSPRRLLVARSGRRSLISGRRPRRQAPAPPAAGRHACRLPAEGAEMEARARSARAPAAREGKGRAQGEDLLRAKRAPSSAPRRPAPPLSPRWHQIQQNQSRRRGGKPAHGKLGARPGSKPHLLAVSWELAGDASRYEGWGEAERSPPERERRVFPSVGAWREVNDKYLRAGRGAPFGRKGASPPPSRPRMDRVHGSRRRGICLGWKQTDGTPFVSERRLVKPQSASPGARSQLSRCRPVERAFCTTLGERLSGRKWRGPKIGMDPPLWIC
ncbi:serine/arginine repetitive matrix protein 1-like [Varanus komodoensis]|uniref:serine/arginine repetitive matrix protein 1-like n=1 Tax=Varanus komodoensis TaxID=61221 RepID=UPI001CF7CD67|nr:serine/arginine repetitive matrix protein 1-like [Varanus komodoensis]